MEKLQTNINNHPLVIIVNDFSEIYYLKTSTYRSNRELKPYELLIQSNRVVDTRKVYWINEKEFNQKFKSTKILNSDLDQKEVLKIYGKLYFYLNENTPLVSLIKIKVNEKQQLEEYVIYSHRNIVNEDLKSEVNWIKYNTANLSKQEVDKEIHLIKNKYDEILYLSKTIESLGLVNELKLHIENELSQLLDTYPKKVINQVIKELKIERQKEKDDDDKDEY